MTPLVLLIVAAVLLMPGRHVPLPRAPRPSQRAAASRDADAVQLAETFAAALRAGLPPVDATRWCATSLGAGAPPADPEAVLGWWGDRVPAVGRALAVAERVGSPTADAVSAAADAERERLQVERDLVAGLAGVRVTAWLLTALPVAGAVGVLALGPGAQPPLAWAAMGVGAVATAVGWLALRRLVRRARSKALA